MEGYNKNKISLVIMTAFYLFAGINHFRDPEFYLPLIPPYLPNPNLINDVSGIIEILLGFGLIFLTTRRFAAYGIIAMLIAFIPAHVHFIQIDSCIEGGLCVPQWIGWARLLLIHPLLIWWAWSNSST